LLEKLILAGSILGLGGIGRGEVGADAGDTQMGQGLAGGHELGKSRRRNPCAADAGIDLDMDFGLMARCAGSV
jgi:hypothetical protein